MTGYRPKGSGPVYRQWLLKQRPIASATVFLSQYTAHIVRVVWDPEPTFEESLDLSYDRCLQDAARLYENDMSNLGRGPDWNEVNWKNLRIEVEKNVFIASVAIPVAGAIAPAGGARGLAVTAAGVTTLVAIGSDVWSELAKDPAVQAWETATGQSFEGYVGRWGAIEAESSVVFSSCSSTRFQVPLL